MKRSLLALALVATGIIACQDNPGPGKTTAGDVRDSVGAAARTTGAYVSDSKDAYVAKAQAELDEANAKLGKLRAEAKDAAADTRAQIDAKVADLEKQRDAAGARLTELKDATGDAWRELAAGVSKAVGDLKDSASEAAKRYE